eukprot:Ihof_evm1s935 gene=Ihof_evmTU1s935
MQSNRAISSCFACLKTNGSNEAYLEGYPTTHSSYDTGLKSFLLARCEKIL